MTSAVCILIIEDEAPIRRFLRASLEAQQHQLVEATTAQEGLSLAATNAPDLILLDLGLPDLDGLEVLKRLREFISVPIIILSARGKERDKIDALDSGADDYLTKPFSIGELSARIRVALRHSTKTDEVGSFQVQAGDIRIDLETRRVFRSSQEVRLTPNEYKILAKLAKHAGKVVTQNQMMTEVWGSVKSGQEHHLRVYMHQLRLKLEEEPANPRHLITEPWIGYRLNVEDVP
ncbi:MAG: response regulator [Candidatus Sumerlaeia bacterium]|nr:response regulator [Candidatus Sumerlaeia bacterium]